MELLVFYNTAGAHRGGLAPLLIANLALLAILCGVAADFSLVERVGKAVLLGTGVALLMPGSVMLDQVVAVWSPDWDAATWLAVLLPYLMLLLALSAAEAGLYLLATRPRVSP
ncbi:MAG TPA: hypothetical protein VFL27_03400 [Candidatus Dormibacteraeota bacterium]|nr:hypothetical protein [Candidatus Dormibacteraeota bacterium]